MTCTSLTSPTFFGGHWNICVHLVEENAVDVDEIFLSKNICFFLLSLQYFVLNASPRFCEVMGANIKSTSSWALTCQPLYLQLWLRPSRLQSLKACTQFPCVHSIWCSVYQLRGWTLFNGSVYEGWSMEETWERCLRPHSPLLFQVWLNDQTVAHINLLCSRVLLRDEHVHITPAPKKVAPTRSSFCCQTCSAAEHLKLTQRSSFPPGSSNHDLLMPKCSHSSWDQLRADAQREALQGLCELWPPVLAHVGARLANLNKLRRETVKMHPQVSLGPTLYDPT